MKSQVTLLLICTLFSKALSLTCQQCLPSVTTCETTTCPDQCATSTTAMLTSGVKIPDISIKTCGAPDLCVNGSMNLGVMKMLTNTKCCSTDLCNTQTLPAPAPQSANGRMCYTCDSNTCSGTVNCEGHEDRCITATVKQGGNTVSMKGCVSKSLCANTGSSTSALGVTSMQCCDGNLCNGAESFTLSFILMTVPLLSSMLFY